MPRQRKSKSKGRRSRRTRNTKTARLIELLRRFGMVTAVIVLTAWVGAWLWFGGVVHKTGDYIVDTYYKVSVAQGFAVREILVEGREYTDPEALLALMDIDRGDPLLSFQPDRVQDDIEGLSWVRSARVQRRLPDTIYVHVEERKPLALWQHNKTVKLIDTFGEVITGADIAAFPDLLIVTGEDAPETAIYLVEMLESEPALVPFVEAASRVGNRRWDLRLKTGATVKLPADDIGVALRRLASAHEEDGLLKKNLIMIDLRNSDRMVVRTAPGAVKSYKAGFFVNSRDESDI